MANIEVILLQDVKALGKKGEIVSVSEGYARNFLLKKKMGLEATSQNRNDLKLQEANKAKIAKEKLEEAKRQAEELKELTVTVKLKSGAGGKTFGSISTKEIAQAVKEQLDREIDKKKMVLDEPIKTLGSHVIHIKLHPEVTAQMTVKVIEG